MESGGLLQASFRIADTIPLALIKGIAFKLIQPPYALVSSKTLLRESFDYLTKDDTWADGLP